MELDTVLETLGGYGTYQMLVYFLVCLVCMRGAWHPLVTVFISATPPHQCRQQENVSYVWNSTQSAQCYLDSNSTNASSTEGQCPNGWVYNLDHMGNTIVNEWDIVCDREYLLPISTSIFMGGVMLGALFISVIADQLGRRRVMCVCLALQAVIGFGCAFANDLILFSCLRFLIGALNQGISLSGYVLVTELFPSHHRTRPGIAIQLFWALGIMVLAGLAYWLQNWRHLQMIISIPSLLLAASYWFIPESLPWLLANGKTKEAEKILNKMEKLNKRKLPSDITGLFHNKTCHENSQIELVDAPTTSDHHTRAVSPDDSNASRSEDKEDVNGYRPVVTDVPSGGQPDEGSVYAVSKTELLRQNSETAGAKTYHVFHLFTRPKMALYTIITCYLWMANSLDYYGISLSTSELAGDPYLNFFISGLVEVPAYIFCMFALEHLGRRIPLAVFQLIGGIGNICTVFIPTTSASGEDLTKYITALAMIGKFGITGSFSTVFLYSSELFPTSIRNGSVGFSSFWDTLGALCAPFVIYSAKTMPQLPQAIFGAMAIIAGLLTLILPETLNHPLPETIEDVESRDRKIPKFCSCKRRVGDDTCSDNEGL